MGGYIYNRLFCIWKSIFAGYLPFGLDHGISCPACGLTRAGIRLLHLDFKGAWKMHPFIYAFAAGVVIFAWKRYICKKPIGKWFKTGCVVCVVLMVIYYVWRMYRYFPDQPPMSYYHYNLLRLLMDVAFGALK